MKLDGAQIMAMARTGQKALDAAQKSGWKTTEFWTHTILPLACAALTIAFGAPAAPVVAVVAGATTIAYGAGRVLVKLKEHDYAAAVKDVIGTVEEVTRVEIPNNAKGG